MTIGIDGNEANQEKRVGIGQYAFQLLRHLYKTENQAVKKRKDKVDFIIYLKDKPRSDLPKGTDWWRYKKIGPKKLWTQFALPLSLFLQKERLDVFFSPTHYSPRFAPCDKALSVMDLSFLHYPEMFKKSDLYKLRNWTEYSVKKSVKIFTISEFTKKDIIKNYKVKESKVVVTYPGYDKSKFKIEESKFKIDRVRDKYSISESYILYVGTLQPRKNIVRLVEAFSRITNYQSRITNIKLVIVGKKGWLYEEIFEKVKSGDLVNEVIFTGYADDEDLRALYSGAVCLVLPSLFEGFGLPVVEAMACGCPVVVSNVSSLPEVAGSAGVYVDPKKTDDIARGLVEVISLSLNKRQSIVNKGLSQAKKFSWEKCAEETQTALAEMNNQQL